MVENLVPNNPNHLKALLACYRIYDHIPMDPNKVLGIEYSILILACSIDDLGSVVLVSVSDDFAEGAFYGRIVGVDEVAVHILD